ncbi:MAG: hypothetical protein IRY94_06705 [Rhodospirillaceae bacterium]|nr:hypothetical protein [Rhodospirillaceae bacterium]
MRGTRSEPAYHAYLEGQYGFSLSSREALERSRRSFERATRIDPSFARAWSALSYTYVQGWLQGWSSDHEMERAADLARRGVALAPTDYLTHWHLAFYLLNVKRFDEAVAECEAALALSEESQDLLVEMAEALICAGRMDDGIRLIERARRTADWERWDSAWRRCLSARGKPDGYHEGLTVLNALHRRPGDPRGLIDIQLLGAAMGVAPGPQMPTPANGAGPRLNGAVNGVNGHRAAPGLALGGTSGSEPVPGLKVGRAAE